MVAVEAVDLEIELFDSAGVGNMAGVAERENWVEKRVERG